MPAIQTLDDLYRQHSRRVLATLIRLLGDFDLAEEAMQEAFAAALQQWPQQGLPEQPLAWLIGTGRHKGIDQLRRRQRLQPQHDEEPWVLPAEEAAGIDDDLLRLIFTCCHPALATEAQLALTLREVCGLTTEQVASALLQRPATLAQRIVRAKQKIRAAAIPYEVPEAAALPERLAVVLKVVYLMFNEGYSSSQGEQVLDLGLSAEAIRLAWLLAQLLPAGEVFGLLALMLLHDARKYARQDAAGDLVTLEEQDRRLWDRTQIDEGLDLLALAWRQPVGPYGLQAAIAAEHAQSSRPQDTDWPRIAELYQALYRLQPSPVVALNRAVALAMADTPARGLALLDELGGHKAIQGYHLYHAARADLYRRAGQHAAARAAYRRALDLCRQQPERRFLARRLRELDGVSEKNGKK
ncbi:RNA polymerase subunit sigma-24 [Zobellella endophytica]|uniref:RNA polymerase subunit sigma-24 n=1 Tax=Zobellella endophytica TaxID=2116700 RepID=A0A2P7RBA4_9GAMM|nr:RNA polymerase sigma factor [Zobellella endophytica]PSJ47501.1 RNA polymerase subunit sigma-24 [Zobellella endophytica]